MVTFLMIVVGLLLLIRITRGPRQRKVQKYEDECRAWQTQENERREWMRRL